LHTWIVISPHSRHCISSIKSTIHDQACINVFTITATTSCRHRIPDSRCGMRDRMKVESVSCWRAWKEKFEYETSKSFPETDSEFIESPYGQIYGRLPSSRENSSRGYISSNSGAFRNSQQQLNYIGDWE
jgi:hypothetical protein